MNERREMIRILLTELYQTARDDDDFDHWKVRANSRIHDYLRYVEAPARPA